MALKEIQLSLDLHGEWFELYRLFLVPNRVIEVTLGKVTTCEGVQVTSLAGAKFE